jgi:hypothetical protein
MKDLFEEIEVVTESLKLKRLNIDEFKKGPNYVSLKKRVHSPTSGLNDKFNYCEFNIVLERISEYKYSVNVSALVVEGDVPANMARRIEDEELEFADLDSEDIDREEEETETTVTFNNVGNALLYIDDTLDYDN